MKGICVFQAFTALQGVLNSCHHYCLASLDSGPFCTLHSLLARFPAVLSRL